MSAEGAKPIPPSLADAPSVSSTGCLVKAAGNQGESDGSAPIHRQHPLVSNSGVSSSPHSSLSISRFAGCRELEAITVAAATTDSMDFSEPMTGAARVSIRLDGEEKKRAAVNGPRFRAGREGQLRHTQVRGLHGARPETGTAGTR
ncbi:hypothetical protein AAFF_G00138230 [Aldrovandia affinis]|uniref:Uncharacterized protein n=1 Tax=Aldrovandia affinis TaxID=143900 RepID=A0AAD7TBX9_9TELE|nr:hypothetical protein AAFF_G00138230 [Aldrovandia affinis]